GYKFRAEVIRYDIALVVALVIGGFYTIYGAISTQYLVWLLPFIILTSTHYALVYSAVSTVAAIGFYYAHNVSSPWLIQGPWDTLTHSHGLEMIDSYRVWVVSTLVWYLTVAVEFIRSLLRLVPVDRGSDGLWRATLPWRT